MPDKKPSTIPQKAMDIHTPSTAPTTTTSRPVIVPNRPMAGDPMLNTTASTPASSDASPVASSAPVGRHTKTITPIEGATSDDSQGAAIVAAPDPVEPSAQESVQANTSDPSAESQSAEPPINPLADTSTTSDIADDAHALASHGKDASPLSASTASIASLDDEDDEGDVTSDTGTAVQEKTAEQMRAEQLEEFIAKGTYAVPLNRTGRRRSAYLLGLALTAVVAVLVLNLLLDLNIIQPAGVPHTDILAP